MRSSSALAAALVAWAPIAYQLDGRQYVSLISDHTLMTFGLRH